MGLNSSKGNMYEFVTHTWNTVKGACLHDCSYCYMKRWGQLKPVRFDDKELKTDLGKDNFIFVGSSCDMWAKGTPLKWQEDTLEHCHKYDNGYLFQSKNPGHIFNYLPPKSVICVTMETNRWYPDIMRQSPNMKKRLMGILANQYPCYITIEPVMDFDTAEFINILQHTRAVQVNIGADSGNNNLPEPPKEKLLELINELQKFTVIHSKKNLARLLK